MKNLAMAGAVAAALSLTVLSQQRAAAQDCPQQCLRGGQISINTRLHVRRPLDAVPRPLGAELLRPLRLPGRPHGYAAGPYGYPPQGYAAAPFAAPYGYPPQGYARGPVHGPPTGAAGPGRRSRPDPSAAHDRNDGCPERRLRLPGRLRL